MERQENVAAAHSPVFVACIEGTCLGREPTQIPVGLECQDEEHILNSGGAPESF